MIKIEKNIPIPSNTTKRSKYPFIDMKIGDSFFITTDHNPEHTRKRVAAAASMFSKERGWRFKTQVSQQGVRVWRIA